MSADDHIGFGAFQLDRSSYTLTRGGQVIPISYRCVKALTTLEAGAAPVDLATGRDHAQWITFVRVSVDYAFARRRA